MNTILNIQGSCLSEYPRSCQLQNASHMKQQHNMDAETHVLTTPRMQDVNVYQESKSDRAVQHDSVFDCLCASQECLRAVLGSLKDSSRLETSDLGHLHYTTHQKGAMGWGTCRDG